MWTHQAIELLGEGLHFLEPTVSQYGIQFMSRRYKRTRSDHLKS